MNTIGTRIVLCLLCVAGPACAMTVDLSAFREQPGLAATVRQEQLEINWEGADRLPLRLILDIRDGVPTIVSAGYEKNGAWIALAKNLSPHFEAVSGMRRSENAYDDAGRWDAYWDAPLVVPGNIARNRLMPRKPEEIVRGSATFHAVSARVKTDGARLEVTFPNLSMGIFTGDYQITVYRGTNLVRSEIIASTQKEWLAYIYQGGFDGFSRDDFDAVNWIDADYQPLNYGFDGEMDPQPVPLKGRGRTAIASGAKGSVAVFPPPHAFFFPRQLEINLGFVYHQKTSDRFFSLGVRQNERHEGYRRDYNEQLWPMFNAPPGTMQRMPAYFFLSPDSAGPCREQVMAFTHDDSYKPLPGYRTMATHFHTAFTMDVLDANDIKAHSPWYEPMRKLGLNIVYLCDFHTDGHPNDPGLVRMSELKRYFDACRAQSDDQMLIVPGEEPNAYLGGHYNILFPKPTYWTLVRRGETPFVEQVDGYGTVYHTGSADDVWEMLKRENGIVWQTHPRAKASTGFPDAIKDNDYFKSDQYLGGGFKALPGDLSKQRLGDPRCFTLLDDMNNWGRPKYLVGEVDTYKKYPDYDLYGDFNVNYMKMKRSPTVDDLSPLVNAMRAGDFFVSTGEVLIPDYSVASTPGGFTVHAEIEWTFPMEFVEIVWGDGNSVNRKIISFTDKPPFGSLKINETISAANVKWVRLGAWDSAVNGAFTQAVHLNK